MVTETASSAWMQKIIGPLVVASILGIAGGGFVLRDAVMALRSDVDYLRVEAEKGGRFTAQQGNWMDLRLSALEAAHDVQQDELDVHKLLQEHVGAARQFRIYNRRMDALEDKMDK